MLSSTDGGKVPLNDVKYFHLFILRYAINARLYNDGCGGAYTEILECAKYRSSKLNASLAQVVAGRDMQDGGHGQEQSCLQAIVGN